MLISLDYDATYTRDADMWLAFVKSAQERGHEVVCVTLRYEHEIQDADFDPRLKELVKVFATGRKAKRQFMRNKGYQIDIWIDDMPEYIIEYS